ESRQTARPVPARPLPCPTRPAKRPPAADPEGPTVRLQDPPERPVADQIQTESDALLFQPTARTDEDVEPLHGNHPADPHHDRVRVRDAESDPRNRPIAGAEQVGRHPLPPEVRAIRTHAQFDRLLAEVVADREDRIGRPEDLDDPSAPSRPP